MHQQNIKAKKMSMKMSLQTSFKDAFGEKLFNRERMSSNSQLSYLTLQRKSKTMNFSNSSDIKTVGDQSKDTSSCFENIFELKEKIDQGTQSVVYKCIMKNDESENIYAAKTTRISCPEKLQTLREKSELLKSLKNPYIPKVIYSGVNQNQSKFYLVTEYFQYQTLRGYINRKIKSRQKIYISEKIMIIRSILEALQYLHEHGIAHRDIKPENIMYNHKTWELKLIDFDIAKQNLGNQTTFMWTDTGTLHYKSPEIFLGDYGVKIDIWALGVIFYQLMTQKLPFYAEYVDDVKKQIMEKQLSYSQTIFTPQIKNFIKRCLQKNPQNRMSASEALQDSLLSQNINDYYWKQAPQTPSQFSADIQNDSFSESKVFINDLQRCLGIDKNVESNNFQNVQNQLGQLF